MFADKTGENNDGEMLRQVFAGGDRLYWKSEEEVLDILRTPGPILVHRLTESKSGASDFFENLIINLFITMSCVMAPAIAIFGRDNRGPVFLITFIALVIVQIWLGRSFKEMMPFKNWYVEKTIDTTKRILKYKGSGTNKETNKEETFSKSYPLDDLALLCYQNCRWEDGCTVDLALVHHKKSKKTMNYDSKSFICHIFKIDQPEGDYSKQKIPDSVKRVADTFIEVTGIKFVDLYTGEN